MLYARITRSDGTLADATLLDPNIDAVAHFREALGDPGATVETAELPFPGLLATFRTRSATTYQLMLALTDAQRTAYATAKAWDQRLFSARDTPWPEGNEKIARISAALGTTPAAWFDAALSPVA